MFYIFHGDDTHSQKETLNSLIAKFGDPGMIDLNTTRLNGAISFNELRQACDAMPFLAPVRVVIVTDFFASKPDKTVMDKLVAYLAELPDSARLIFLESATLRDNHRALKAADQLDGGYVKFFKSPEGSNLERWIRQRVVQKGGEIAPRAAHELAANVGNNLQILDNELEKLVLYKLGDGPIEGRDVALLSPYAAEATIFDLVDAIGNRNSRRAAVLFHEKIQEGADPFYLFSMFIRQFRLLIQVKELADDGLKPPAIAKAIKQHPFVVNKLYQQARGFGLPQLEQIYRHFLKIDVDVKTGKADMLTSLNLLLASLTVVA